MLISLGNSDNSLLFNQVLGEYPNFMLLIVVKNYLYLPNLCSYQPSIVVLFEEEENPEHKKQLAPRRVFFQNNLQKQKLPVQTTPSFADRIYKNLLHKTEKAWQEAARYAAIVYNELDLPKATEMMVISATQNYPDSLVLLSPSSPETTEKTQIKKVLVYPKAIM